MRNTINLSSHQLLTNAHGRYFVQNLGMYGLLSWKYDDEFKREAVRKIHDGQSVASVARRESV